MTAAAALSRPTVNNNLNVTHESLEPPVATRGVARITKRMGALPMNSNG